jgi:hypothetical protein
MRWRPGLIIWMHWVHFLNFFYFRRAQRDSAEKTSKFGLNEYSVQDEKLTYTCIHKSVLIIACHWHGFGGMGDKFDPIMPPKLPSFCHQK